MFRAWELSTQQATKSFRPQRERYTDILRSGAVRTQDVSKTVTCIGAANATQHIHNGQRVQNAGTVLLVSDTLLASGVAAEPLLHALHQMPKTEKHVQLWGLLVFRRSVESPRLRSPCRPKYPKNTRFPRQNSQVWSAAPWQPAAQARRHCAHSAPSGFRGLYGLGTWVQGRGPSGFR